ncbi:MAG: cysteine hydrolase [Candidatus Woesearchaeota archaeon]|nr:cysteine hydrolase [Candidatus Woesearchaeota archaeon]
MTKAIVVVDMLNDFVKKEYEDGQNGLVKGKLVVEGVEGIVNNIRKMRNVAGLYAGVSMVYANDAHAKEDPEFIGYGGNWPEHCVKGTTGAEVVPDLMPFAADVVLEKQTLFMFSNPDADAVLRQKGVDELYITGVATEYCVRAAALDAIARGYKVNVVVDAIAGVDEIVLADGTSVPETKGAVARALMEMGNAGARPVYTARVLEEIVR